MANFSDKADEVVGRAKQAAGDLTGNDGLHAEGTADKTRAQLKQGVDVAVDKASEQVSELADKATDTVEQLHLDDRRFLVVAAVAGITLTLLVRKVRGNRPQSHVTVTKRAAKRATKRAAKTGLGRALTS